MGIEILLLVLLGIASTITSLWMLITVSKFLSIAFKKANKLFEYRFEKHLINKN